MKITIVNGPNLNLLGKRESEIYGSKSFEDYLLLLKKKYSAIEIDYYQSNIEGELVNFIQKSGFEKDGIILNAGAYTHTSVALRDAIAAIPAPVVEVHISNVFSREDFRHVSLLGAKCSGSISGFGLDSYELALMSFMIHVK